MDKPWHYPRTSRKGLQTIVRYRHSDGDTVTTMIEEEGTTMWILSSYMAHDQVEPPPGTMVAKAANAARMKGIPYIIGADANAHHQLWGSLDTNRRGMPRNERRVSFRRENCRPPWWTAEIAELRQKCRRLFNEAKRTGNWTLYKASTNRFKNLTRNAKRRSWRDFVEILHAHYGGYALGDHEFLSVQISRSGWDYPWQHNMDVIIPWLLEIYGASLVIYTSRMDKEQRHLYPEGRKHAYTKGRSVETALHSLVGHIEKANHYGNFTMVAFMDIEGAFNNVDPMAVVGLLNSWG
ncbi:hypothetical protein EVAR_91111_1 [Eumeta japonica]|uniref:Reverse transcriptase domain-containing protein n=1 Tax=Eumeta variegata TaxID=151549 RepID=A0A4C1SPK3_EUMVA|nr:hypothetical protein EVAR_91111_1 [Eumeta japonica]